MLEYIKSRRALEDLGIVSVSATVSAEAELDSAEEWMHWC